MRKRAETTDTLAYQGRAIIHFHEKLHRYSVSVPALDKWRISQPGVTTILGIKDKSGPLQAWTANQCELYGQIKIADNPRSWMYNEDILKILREMKTQYRKTKAVAAEIGVIVHDYLHQTLLSRQAGSGIRTPERPVLSESLDSRMVEQANASIDAGLEFFEAHRLTPLTMERPVWSPKFGFIGTDDFIGTVDDELCVVDYKTSKRLYSDVWLQLAAYQAAYTEEHPETGQQFVARWGVNTGKDGRLDAQRRANDSHFENDLSAFLAFRKGWHWDRIESEGNPIEIVGSLDSIPVSKEEEW